MANHKTHPTHLINLAPAELSMSTPDTAISPKSQTRVRHHFRHGPATTASDLWSREREDRRWAEREHVAWLHARSDSEGGDGVEWESDVKDCWYPVGMGRPVPTGQVNNIVWGRTGRDAQLCHRDGGSESIQSGNRKSSLETPESRASPVWDEHASLAFDYARSKHDAYHTPLMHLELDVCGFDAQGKKVRVRKVIELVLDVRQFAGTQGGTSGGAQDMGVHVGQWGTWVHGDSHKEIGMSGGGYERTTMQMKRTTTISAIPTPVIPSRDHGYSHERSRAESGQYSSEFELDDQFDHHAQHHHTAPASEGFESATNWNRRLPSQSSNVLSHFAQNETNRILHERENFLRNAFAYEPEDVQDLSDLLSHEPHSWGFEKIPLVVRGQDGTVLSLGEGREDTVFDGSEGKRGDVKTVETLVLEQMRFGGSGRSRMFDLPTEGSAAERGVRRARWVLGEVVDGFVGIGGGDRFVMEKWRQESFG